MSESCSDGTFKKQWLLCARECAEEVAYRVFDWEVNDSVLVIHHLPRTQRHHISVLYRLWTNPCRNKNRREGEKKIWLYCVALPFVTSAFHYHNLRPNKCTLVMTINTPVEQEAARSSSPRASAAYKKSTGEMDSSKLEMGVKKQPHYNTRRMFADGKIIAALFMSH